MTRKDNQQTGHNVIYGVHPVLETLKSGKRRVHEVFFSRDPLGEQILSLVESRNITLTKLAQSDLATVAATPHHQGLAARVGTFPYVDIDDFTSNCLADAATVLILDEVQDPQNLGNVLRSSECLGAAAVLLSKDRSVPVTATVEKAAAGASAHVPIIRVINLVRAIQQLKAASFWIYAADAGARDNCYSTDLTGRVGLVLGSEGKGIRRLVRENADLRISIPMAGKVASLNVAQSAAILLAESLRQRLVKQAGK